jgi:chromosome segregation ATPase
VSTTAGKSSILHAIQVVFGSRALDTSRGTKIADLIHHGREEAVIEVLVKNEGDGAFKHEQYGDTIAIVKKIRRNGAGTTRVLNHATGAEVSRSPSEVAELCAHFNILVSNPCVIMTQEVSKKFLQSKKAEDKYTFFLQATQLEWLRASLADSKLKIAQMEHTVALQREKIPDLDRKIQDLQSVGLGHQAHFCSL